MAQHVLCAATSYNTASPRPCRRCHRSATWTTSGSARSPVRPGREHDTTALRCHDEILPLLKTWIGYDLAALGDLGALLR
ncbi:hypothetical protein KUA19_37265 [Catellatospora sp. NEAU-YM18]|nr:hypothetical protein [Catellatospora tritici]MBV1855783.1 hypothetical protein [Catellatospora tritici]